MRVVLWGISNILKTELEKKEYLIDDDVVVGYIDNDPRWKGRCYRGKWVISPSEILEHLEEFDYILITSLLYKDEIYVHAMSIRQLRGKIIPFEFLSASYDEAYSDAFIRQYDHNIEIIKNWYICNGARCLIFSVKNEVGNLLNVRYLQGGIGKNNLGIKCRIFDLHMGEKVYEGEINENIEISIHNELSVFRIQLDGLAKAFVSLCIDDGNKYKSILCGKTQKAYCKAISRQYDKGFHDFDYTFITKLREIANGTIIDIGANLGQSSMTFLEKTNFNVIALEPHPIYMSALKILKSIYENRFYYLSCGAGEKDGMLTFYVPKFEKDITQEASFHKERAIYRVESKLKVSVTAENENEYIERIEVPVKSIDSISDINKQMVLFVKIDAEEFEFDVIKGMKNLIKVQQPIILLEYSSLEQMEKIIKCVSGEAGYTVKYWDYASNRFVDQNIRSSINYFLVPEGNSHFEINSKGEIIIKNGTK